ncbi:DNA-directed RNA polymerase III subunit RPC8-like [Lineus longissimus]|uniref:DNA-directed RNA polymerase III subunit RPC8-like n=1 Tax=Lineus longissimus TaxID=88925 RepID=UPI002B4FAE27
MFVLTEMKDTVRIPPRLFNINLYDGIVESLNKKFANKVVHNVGLCIALWDVTTVEDSYIFPGDGSSHTVVHFRYVVFRPFMEEILQGRIKSCSKEGVHVTLGFFDDILIAADALQHPARFDENEQVWVWEYATEDGSHDLFMDVGEVIRFRVAEETFVDTTPSVPESGSDAKDTYDGDLKKSPYSIVGSISEPGLGLLSWWNNT